MSTLGWRDIGVYGEAIETGGLSVRQGISGVGLVTHGFLWGVYDIYINTETALTTTWADSNASITTTWTDSNSVITTTWTDDNFGMYSEALSD